MRSTWFLAVVGAAFAISSCAAGSNLADRWPLDLRVEPANDAFLLSLVNPSGHDRCIVSDLWPTPGGQLHFASQDVRVEDDGRVFPVRDQNTGYCPDCQVRVPAMGSVSAVLPYAEFPGLPDSPPSPHATLTLPFTETPCRVTP